MALIFRRVKDSTKKNYLRGIADSTKIAKVVSKIWKKFIVKVHLPETININ